MSHSTTTRFFLATLVLLAGVVLAQEATESPVPTVTMEEEDDEYQNTDSWSLPPDHEYSPHRLASKVQAQAQAEEVSTQQVDNNDDEPAAQTKPSFSTQSSRRRGCCTTTSPCSCTLTNPRFCNLHTCLQAQVRKVRKVLGD